MTVPVAVELASRAASVQKIRSPGGIEAWLVEDYAVPLVACDFAFKGGSSQDLAGKAGTASMLGGLLDEGAGHLDADSFHRALDDKAIELSFAAERDGVSGRLKTLSRNIDAAFELLRLAVSAPRLDADAIDRVKSQITAGLKRESKDPDAVVGRVWREAAFPGHPYGLPVRGTLDTLPVIGRADLVDAFETSIARTGLKIAVVGAIDGERLAGLLDKVFGDLPDTGRQRPIADVLLAPGGKPQVVDLDIPQSTIRFGLDGVPRKDPDHMPAVVLNHILGGGVFSARLFREVREKRGLAYSVYSQLANFDHTSIFSGGTSTKNERAKESLDVIEDEIGKLAADGPTEEELVKAKKFLTGSYALRFDTSLKIASQLVHLQMEGFDVSYLDERNGLIEAVTLEDTQRVAKRLFGKGPLLVAMVGRPVGV